MTDPVPSKDLLPCPFCRSAVQFCSDATHECHYIVCSGCEAVVDMSLGTSEDIELLADVRAACMEKWNKRSAPEPEADEPPARYQCMVKGCPANHVSKRDVCDTRPCEAIAVWLDAEGNFQWDFEINEDHPIDATIALARRTNWVMTDEGWRLAQPPRDGQ